MVSGSWLHLRECILRNFFTKEGCPRASPCLADGAQHGQAEQVTGKQVGPCGPFSPGATGAAMLTETCHTGASRQARLPHGVLAPGPRQGLFTRTKCQDTTPRLTPRFWLTGSRVPPAPKVINKHQRFDAYPDLGATALSFTAHGSLQV